MLQVAEAGCPGFILYRSLRDSTFCNDVDAAAAVKRSVKSNTEY